MAKTCIEIKYLSEGAFTRATFSQSKSLRYSSEGTVTRVTLTCLNIITTFLPCCKNGHIVFKMNTWVKECIQYYKTYKVKLMAV